MFRSNVRQARSPGCRLMIALSILGTVLAPLCVADRFAHRDKTVVRLDFDGNPSQYDVFDETDFSDDDLQEPVRSLFPAPFSVRRRAAWSVSPSRIDASSVERTQTGSNAWLRRERSPIGIGDLPTRLCRWTC